MQALGEQVELFSEAVAAKDHVVVELTNQVIRVAVATGAELGVGLLYSWACQDAATLLCVHVHMH